MWNAFGPVFWQCIQVHCFWTTFQSFLVLHFVSLISWIRPKHRIPVQSSLWCALDGWTRNLKCHQMKQSRLQFWLWWCSGCSHHERTYVWPQECQEIKVPCSGRFWWKPCLHLSRCLCRCFCFESLNPLTSWHLGNSLEHMMEVCSGFHNLMQITEAVVGIPKWVEMDVANIIEDNI